ncbi:unnamed protein product [Ixodes pacificus]
MTEQTLVSPDNSKSTDPFIPAITQIEAPMKFQLLNAASSLGTDGTQERKGGDRRPLRVTKDTLLGMVLARRHARGEQAKETQTNIPHAREKRANSLPSGRAGTAQLRRSPKTLITKVQEPFTLCIHQRWTFRWGGGGFASETSRPQDVHIRN